MATIGLDILADLGCQLPGRGQHQGSRLARGLARTLGQQLQQRQGEAGRLAGAGLGAGEQIAAFEDERNRLFLNRRGFAVALFGHSTKNFGRKAE